MSDLMSVLGNNTSLISRSITDFSYYVSGDATITLFLLFVFFILIALLFRFNIEWLSIILIPISIYFIAIDPRFAVIGGVLFLVVAIMLYKLISRM